MKQAPALRHKKHSTMLLATVIAAASLLAACGGEKKSSSTQVAAKVNKEEISVHQINFVLQRTPGLKPEQTPVASKRVLESLIDQELALQQATEQKLDREPGVVMAIETAKREIIARAYADKLANTASKPSEAEIEAYYKAHPGLFEQRRIYALQEFSIEADADQQAGLRSKLQTVQSAEQAEATLKSAAVRHASRQLTQAPENLPIAVVDKLAGLREGQFLVTPAAKGFSLLFINAVKPAPIPMAQAKPLIENFLLSERKRQLVADGLKALRKDAKIEYVGQFAVGAASAPTQEPLPQPAQPQASGLDESSLQKGLSGLK